MQQITIWRFDGAPEEYRQLSTNGGDEDYVMHVPASMVNDFLVAMITDQNNHAGHAFGCCSIDCYPQPDGSVVYIGAHA